MRKQRLPTRRDFVAYQQMVVNMVRDFLHWLHSTILERGAPPSQMEVDVEIHHTVVRILNLLRRKFPSPRLFQSSSVSWHRLPKHLIPLIVGKRYDDLIQFLRRYSEDVIKQVASTLNTAILEGWSPSERKSALASLLMQKEWEAERVARTEGVRLANYTIYSHYGDQKLVVGWRYDVVLDGRTSKVCLPLANKVVLHTDRTLIPPLHPNCRTILVPVFDEEDIRRAKEDVVGDDYVESRLPEGWWVYKGHTPSTSHTRTKESEST